ncbi:MAG: transposase [Candidatus Parvarchaeota archaeon]
MQELTDKQWRTIQHLIPKQTGTGKPRADDRETLNAILYVMSTGCMWDYLSKTQYSQLHHGMEEAQEVGGGWDMEEDTRLARLEGILWES